MVSLFLLLPLLLLCGGFCAKSVHSTRLLIKTNIIGSYSATEGPIRTAQFYHEGCLVASVTDGTLKVDVGHCFYNNHTNEVYLLSSSRQIKAFPILFYANGNMDLNGNVMKPI